MENPTPKKRAELTGMEQRYADRLKKEKEGKSTPPPAESKKK